MARRRLAGVLVVAAALVAGAAAAAEAAVLTTPLLLVSSNTFVSCLVSNVSDRKTTVRIEVIGFHGTTLADSGEVTLGPGESDGQSGFETARCKFTVDNKSAVRALVTVNHGGIGLTSSVEAR